MLAFTIVHTRVSMLNKLASSIIKYVWFKSAGGLNGLSGWSRPDFTLVQEVFALMTVSRYSLENTFKSIYVEKKVLFQKTMNFSLLIQIIELNGISVQNYV
ncbi:hypothetical protein BpHYR1_043384 [Brachionus plicatilis]|uniref:Uncharacterized protein n=1 Tax=Brachionus plicatilis TaxID=10195 RepID=A0A3M7QVL8_BRAPC|nr:hypothetical protein BpHYR1_043384 [Brachionus plicatilis]